LPDYFLKHELPKIATVPNFKYSLQKGLNKEIALKKRVNMGVDAATLLFKFLFYYVAFILLIKGVKYGTY
jgi:hypothetical protein